LLFAIIAYRIQADRLGDLDRPTKQVLERTDRGTTMSARLVSFDQKRTELTPGTVLVREWDRHSQRVMVMPDGFAWNGQTYDSLSNHLTRHLLFAIIAYRIQADRFGDLDYETKQVLDRTAAKETGPAMSARLASFDQKRTELTPGTVLVREWDRQSQRVMVMADGFAWNGRRRSKAGATCNRQISNSP
jgi:Protein of unknown function (DUF2924)